MKRVAIVLGAVAAVLLGAVALVWFVPAAQDRIVQSAMTRQVSKAARAPYLTDDALHILLLPGLVPGIHELLLATRRGWPGQARP